MMFKTDILSLISRLLNLVALLSSPESPMPRDERLIRERLLAREKIGRGFYLRPTVEVARDLLGKIFVRRLGKGFLAGRIVEVEAYTQDGDLASHSARGRTARNEVMFRSGGHLYVYFTYGMHFCMNVVTEEEGKGCAVLIRAVEPLAGLGRMRKNRSDAIPDIRLANGPANCCRAFGIARGQNGYDLTGDIVCLREASSVPDAAVGVSRRIGIRRSVGKRWRFYEKNNPCLSR